MCQVIFEKKKKKKIYFRCNFISFNKMILTEISEFDINMQPEMLQ